MQILNLFLLVMTFPCVLCIFLFLNWFEAERPTTITSRARAAAQTIYKHETESHWDVQHFFEKIYRGTRAETQAETWNVQSFFNQFT